MHPDREADPTAQRPKLRNKDMDKLVAAAWEAGWKCVRSGKNYILCYPPDGGRMVTIPSTPSSSKTYANKRAPLRRGGVNL